MIIIICAYCKKEKDKTKEHIISDSVLQLFPECDLTYDEIRKKHYKADPIIKDVCSDCNNTKLSYIDEYAKNIISKYFIDEYDASDSLEFEYKYDEFLKVLMKYTYNDLRSHNDDVSIFDKESINFLLDKSQKKLNKCISIFGGLCVNTSPVPEFVFGNKKIQWSKNPTFLENSIILNYNYDTGQVMLRDNLKQMEIKGLKLSYFYKFNSGLFVILFWENEEIQKQNEQILSLSYPYKLLSSDDDKVLLERCTHAYNCHIPNLIDVTWGIGIADSTNGMVRTDISPIQIQKDWNKGWNKHEHEIRLKHTK
ncbi:hypothetical protein [Tepidibacter sp. Z1-5]|uniref:hypothetical protein n=1 Tax=Tepidibacter sp. Z1-5 TaxID=3134138 RepID=UPI0030BAA80A